MSFFKNFGDELGTGAGKGIVVVCRKGWEFLGWLFTWEHSRNENELHTNSKRIATWSLLAALFFVPGLVTCSFSPKNVIDTIFNPTNEKVTLKIQLNKQDIPYFPAFERFQIDEEQDIQHYSKFEGRKLFAYHRSYTGRPKLVEVELNSCALLPTSEEIYLSSKTPPVFVANIEDKVMYIRRYDSFNIFEKMYINFFYSESVPNGHLSFATWKELSNSWQNVNTEKYAIKARAMAKSEIDPKTAGGLICF